MTTWAKRAAVLPILGTALWLADNIRAMAAPYVEPPAQVGEWRLATPPQEAGSWSGIAQARRICVMRYAGPVDLRLILFDMPALPGSSPFDAYQKWHPQPGQQAFYRKRAFGVVESDGSDPAPLSRFIAAFQPGPQPPQ